MNKSEFFKPIEDAVNLIPDSKRTPLPDWDLETIRTTQMPSDTDRDALWDAFKTRFDLVHGKCTEGRADLLSLLKEESVTAGYVAPELKADLKPWLQQSGIEIHTSLDDSQIDTYEFGITRAAGVIAETGTIILKDQSTSSRLGALSPWIHIAVLPDDAPIYPTLFDAMNDLGNDPYIVFATGPSKTADVEGILIEGVHGPGIQICSRMKSRH
ncbi:LutC/YkgG family protein [Pelagicoccus mobilis]|uniref:LUD domain-containing protein n=1 Tax=Pelagicoccus mobilis TaxID=415221 RepID=A0A934VJ97_9BACT|nr:LUD domain-containing protein [Pelagicoccus mobilis]MBK1875376.1 LUD domain-containing protein [Pelagicoccus mobilis]